MAAERLFSRRQGVARDIRWRSAELFPFGDLVRGGNALLCGALIDSPHGVSQAWYLCGHRLSEHTVSIVAGYWQ